MIGEYFPPDPKGAENAANERAYSLDTHDVNDRILQDATTDMSQVPRPAPIRRERGVFFRSRNTGSMADTVGDDEQSTVGDETAARSVDGVNVVEI